MKNYTKYIKYLIYQIPLNLYQSAHQYPHFADQKRKPKVSEVSSNSNISALQFFGIRIWTLFPLGLTSACFDPGIASLYFHLDRMNANLQEKILNTMIKIKCYLPCFSCLCCGTQRDKRLALYYLTDCLRSP